jgi:sirohydrochlorin ferrochelatase
VAPTKGVLLLAHGGQDVWNANVRAIAAEVDRTLPTEIAFGMADRSALDAAIVRLRGRGVAEIVAVPLFVSSYSSVLASTEYLLGLRADKPRELEVFARMRHGSGSGDHASHSTAASEPVTAPIDVGLPIRMTSALDAHPIVCDIVLDRARALSRQPEGEAVILLAHGPNDAADNDRWLRALAEIARAIATASPFADVSGLTLRDDAPPAVKDAATAVVRQAIQSQTARGRRVLVVPVLLSYGGIEAGIRERLAGLEYVISAKALAPDPRLVDWVIQKALR